MDSQRGERGSGPAQQRGLRKRIMLGGPAGLPVLARCLYDDEAIIRLVGH
jgi:hypothetical protein